MQFKHQAANDHKAKTDDYREKTDKQVVLVSLSFQFLNIIVKVVFLDA